MNIKDEILKKHSKSQTSKLVRYIGGNKSRFAELIKIILTDEPILSQRAAWVLGYAAEIHPELAKPYLKKLLLNLKKPVHPAVKRNTVRFLQFMTIPRPLMGLAAEACFRLLQSPDEPVAVKCFSMTVLCNICKAEPALANELRLVIEGQMPYSSAGYRARGKRVLRELNALC